MLSERVGGTIETAAGRKLGSFRLGMKTLRDKALECQVRNRSMRSKPRLVHQELSVQFLKATCVCVSVVVVAILCLKLCHPMCLCVVGLGKGNRTWNHTLLDGVLGNN